MTFCWFHLWSMECTRTLAIDGGIAEFDIQRTYMKTLEREESWAENIGAGAIFWETEWPKYSYPPKKRNHVVVGQMSHQKLSGESARKRSLGCTAQQLSSPHFYVHPRSSNIDMAKVYLIEGRWGNYCSWDRKWKHPNWMVKQLTKPGLSDKSWNLQN